MVIDHLFKFRVSSFSIVLWICSISIGLGTVNGRLSLLTIGLCFIISILLMRQAKWSVSSALALALIISFLLAYFFFYRTPVMPEHIDGKLYPISYAFKAFPVLFSFFIIFALPNAKQKEFFFIGIAFGMFLFAIINSIATFVYLDPPYYGKAFHFFNKAEYNSPGITILASILPIVLFCLNGYLFDIKKKSRWKHLFFLIILSVSISISFLFNARTFFYIIILNVFFITAIQLWKLFFTSSLNKVYKVIVALLSVSFLSFIFYIFLQDTQIGQRILHGEYSIKLKHYIDYWNAVKDGFFIYPKISIENNGTFWYHNVFFDSHKTSGPITALILYVYSFFIFVIVCINSFRGNHRSIRYFHFYVCLIPYLITTIPWESSEPQMMALFSGLGALITTATDNENTEDLC
ncbi:DUF1229 domain-containing protein [Leptospira alstonii]|uniref:PF06797 family protein n=2 Tax=Leptospira alstonii TaxID=28452 RepID=M6CN38_9LEPT|nr:PF06797 family protein [Leptospira alstonii serovar Sichuan str. 79601]EQA78438.1 PF06797 family protein [Leptospira alstonii serovar Pingchang str. 80-412]